MNFAELNAEVQQIVKRPDLTTRIESAVRAAILKLHTTNFYPRDIEELAVQFNYPNYLTNWNPRETFDRFRKISYIRFWNYDANDSVNNGAPGPMLEHVEIKDVLDYWGNQKTGIYYEAGNLIQIRTPVELEYTLIGAYVFPKVVAGEPIVSWIAEDYPWAVIYEASSQIFKQIGLREISAELTQEAGMQLAILNMQSTGEP